MGRHPISIAVPCLSVARVLQGRGTSRVRYAVGFMLTTVLVACPSSDPLDRDGDGQRSRAAGGDDCDDSNPDIYLGAQELCGNGTDDDCDDDVDEDGVGSQPFYADSDRDGFGAPNTQVLRCAGADGFSENNLDCDDQDASFNPNAGDADCDNRDQNCDGAPDDEAETFDWYEDGDGDGWGRSDVVVASCETDKRDHSREKGDCDDGDRSVHPGADERCNGRDDDCDGDIDGPVIGDGPECAATDCVEVHTRRRPTNGDFWIRDQRNGNAPVEVECASVPGAGDGWTRITLPWIRDDGQSQFDRGGFSGSFVSWVNRDGESVPLLDTAFNCVSPMRWARFEVRTPVAFTEVYGRFWLWADDATRTSLPWAGVDNVSRAWGGDTPRNEACGNGAILFGAGDTANDKLKTGGTWVGRGSGDPWAISQPGRCFDDSIQHRCREWSSNGIEPVVSTDILRWEVHGSLPDKNSAATVRDIDLYIR